MQPPGPNLVGGELDHEEDDVTEEQDEEDEDDERMMIDGLPEINNIDGLQDGDELPLPPEVEESLPAIMGPDDPLRMKLTRQELEWALDIKDVMEMMPELDNLNDFWYAQYAIICEDDIEDAVTRALALQHFRQEYKIVDEYPYAHRKMTSLIIDLMPRQWLSFSFSYADGNYVMIFDMTKFDTTNLTTTQQQDDMFASIYYMQSACCPDLESVRKGYTCCAECEGWDFQRSKQDGKVHQKLFSELFSQYPFRGQCKHYHTGIIMNLLVSACKRLLPVKMRDTFYMGLQFDGRLDETFLVPTLEIANQRMLTSLGEALTKRYTNEKSFTLSSE